MTEVQYIFELFFSSLLCLSLTLLNPYILNNHSLPLKHIQIIIILVELYSCSYWWLHNDTSHKIFLHASEMIRFITGHQVQFGATCHESIANIQRCINSLSLITKVATGEWLSKPQKAEGLSLCRVCEYRSDVEGGIGGILLFIWLYLACLNAGCPKDCGTKQLAWIS